MSFISRFILISVLLGTSQQLRAEVFTVSSIRIEGLERIDEGTVLSYLPVKSGDELDTAQTAYPVRELYKTGFFSEIELQREGDVLVVVLKERPAITEVNFEGNEKVEKEQIEEALKNIGIVAGRVFKRSEIETLEQSLQQVYYSYGKYGVKIKTEVEQLDDNRVNIDINISEGVAAQIKEINIVGNDKFSDAELLEDFALEAPSTFLGMDFDGDQYSRPELGGDLEKLKSFYLDRGYINFKIESTQVSITPDKKDIYITVNVKEGDQFSIDEIILTGDYIFPEEEIRKQIKLKSNDIFSRRKMVESQNAISQKLGNEGYAFNKVNIIPKPDTETKSVTLTFVIQPGKKAYVRRVNFTGNHKSTDEVLRREMRLFEGSELDVSKLNRSKIRLQRLSFIENVDVKTTPVPGTDDQVDLDVSLDERLSGSFNISAGLSQVEGLVFGMNLTQENLNGSGERISIAVNTSDANTVYSVTHTDPYYTLDGISRTFEVNYRKRDASQELLSNYLVDTAQGRVRYGIPISEYDVFKLGFGVETVDVTLASSNVSQDYVDFVDENGDSFADITLVASFSHDTRNRTVFANDGHIQTISLDMTAPGSELTFYKLTYNTRFFFDIGNTHSLMFRGQFALGDGYGDTTELPFFERYFAGGLRTVRGFRTNSLGEIDPVTGLSLGGDMRLVGGLEWIFPVPFMEKPPASVRMSFFYDAGNVFERSETSFSHSFFELRDSIGISYVWLAPIGPLRFSWAKPVSPRPEDETQTFQFSIGSFF